MTIAQKELRQNLLGANLFASFFWAFREIPKLSCAIVTTIAHGWRVSIGAHPRAGHESCLVTPVSEL
ncbi:MAG: hypothetical protein WBD40_25745 [Tepidisphaeraceae bacterium]